MFEVQRKWERVAQVSKAHQRRVLRAEFFHYEPGKIELYEVLSVDCDGNGVSCTHK